MPLLKPPTDNRHQLAANGPNAPDAKEEYTPNHATLKPIFRDFHDFSSNNMKHAFLHCPHFNVSISCSKLGASGPWGVGPRLGAGTDVPASKDPSGGRL
jgi:hypothetical protein